MGHLNIPRASGQPRRSWCLGGKVRDTAIHRLLGIFRQGFEGIPHRVLADAAFLGDLPEAQALPPQTPQLVEVKVDAWSASCGSSQERLPPGSPARALQSQPFV